MKIDRTIIKRRLYLISFTLFIGTNYQSLGQETKPNIIIIMADDAGIGDYQPYSDLLGISDEEKLITPYVDRLASEGLRFDNAHAAGSVCQPSRYGIITGLWPNDKYIHGTSESLDSRLIGSDIITLGQLAKRAGYATSMFGKWHLDYIFTGAEGNAETHAKRADVTQPLQLGVQDYGFDYSFWVHKGVSGSEFFIENDSIVQLKDQILYKEKFPEKPDWNGHKRWQTQKISDAESFKGIKDKRVLGDVFTDKALDHLELLAKAEKPFFMYYAAVAPHAPHLPNDSLNGAPLSKGAKNALGNIVAGDRQKMVYENDIILGQFMEQLKRLNLEENTIVVFTSDNGAGKPGVKNNHASGIYQGSKGTAWEGGHRIPLIIKWPGVIKPDTHSANLVSLIDFFATFKDITSSQDIETDKKNSKSFLPILNHTQILPRDAVISVKHKVEPYDEYVDGYFNVSVQNVLGEKLIAYFDPELKEYKPIAFYLLDTDPTESHNLINNSDVKNKIQELLKSLDPKAINLPAVMNVED